MQTPSEPRAKRLGFFTRLLDDARPAERYRLATEQAVRAEELGFTSAWVAQHHFNALEGGLPSPFVFLAHVAARTSIIRLGTGVVTLVLEDPVRVAEDAAVLDLMSNGRLEIGISAGGTPATFPAFGVTEDGRADVFRRNYAKLLEAWGGGALDDGGNHLYPPAPHLAKRLWHGTFSTTGGRRAGQAGDGLMLSRTQPRPRPVPLADIQIPIIEAYLEALPPGCPPRILASRTVFVADKRDDAFRFAETGLSRFIDRLRHEGRPYPTGSFDDIIASLDVHLGTPEDVIMSLSGDATLARATDVAVQVHSIDPPHDFILRSLELMARRVVPVLGWQTRSTDCLAPA